MIELTYDKLLALCAGFTVVCVAVGWLIKIIKALKKPSDDVHAKLDNDNKRIKTLEDQNGFILKAISLLLQDDMVILNHLRTTNCTGEMKEQEEKVQQFLINR